MEYVEITPLKDDTYDYIIENVNEWFGGRDMVDLLPRLFFKHFANTSFSATINGELVGFLVAFLSPADRQKGYIHFVGVNPDYRKRGIGKLLYQTFFDLCVTHSVKTVNCVTSPINTTSIAYHHSLGFRASDYHRDGSVAVIKNYDGPGNDRILFAKEL